MKHKDASMRRTIPALLLAMASLCVSNIATAELDTESADAILTVSGCAICHATAEKKMGPSWDDIAGKYDDTETTLLLLRDRVRTGSSGVWGQIPMAAIPDTTISDADLSAILQWILAR